MPPSHGHINLPHSPHQIKSAITINYAFGWSIEHLFLAGLSIEHCRVLKLMIHYRSACPVINSCLSTTPIWYSHVETIPGTLKVIIQWLWWLDSSERLYFSHGWWASCFASTEEIPRSEITHLLCFTEITCKFGHWISIGVVAGATNQQQEFTLLTLKAGAPRNWWSQVECSGNWDILYIETFTHHQQQWNQTKFTD